MQAGVHLQFLVGDGKKDEEFGSLDTEKEFLLRSGIPSYPSIRPLSSYKSVCPTGFYGCCFLLSCVKNGYRLS